MGTTGDKRFCIVDASIAEIQSLLSSGSLTCVDLVAKLLLRISAYDQRGPSLNSIPIINPEVFTEAAASDVRRLRGELLGPLDGIPYTVKDSYKVRGMTVANGSPAFQDLVATEDAFTVQTLREAGAILIGRTNMPPVAAGGMQRGVYGRAESPYNPGYLAAAFASGSSNGSAVATTATFAFFGMGEETVSSGRSPASNNALVAYTPSRGGISIRGNWPLYPTCDVVVPHTRTVRDLLALLDVIVAEDKSTQGDLWRHQKVVPLQDIWGPKRGSFQDMADSASLDGVRIAVPAMYVGGAQLPSLPEVSTHVDTLELYRQARGELESLGATVVEIPSFPLVEHYENPASAPADSLKLPEDWHMVERSLLVAHAMEGFLRHNKDSKISSLADVNWQDIFPAYPPDDPQIRYSEPRNRVHYEKLASLARSQTSMFDTVNLATAMQTLEDMRKVWLEEWLDQVECDILMFPAAGDVGRANADVDYQSAEHAWRNGVRYSNGNRVLRHCGVPTVTVPMGIMKSKGMPMGLTFAGRGGDDLKILGYAAIYEEAFAKRTLPEHTPALESDFVVRVMQEGGGGAKHADAPELVIEKCVVSCDEVDSTVVNIEIAGYLTMQETHLPMSSNNQPIIDIFVDATPVRSADVQLDRLAGTMAGNAVLDFHCITTMPAPPQRSPKDQVASRRKIARDATMVLIFARVGKQGRPAGYLQLL